MTNPYERKQSLCVGGAWYFGRYRFCVESVDYFADITRYFRHLDFAVSFGTNVVKFVYENEESVAISPIQCIRNVSPLLKNRTLSNRTKHVLNLESSNSLSTSYTSQIRLGHWDTLVVFFNATTATSEPMVGGVPNAFAQSTLRQRRV